MDMEKKQLGSEAFALAAEDVENSTCSRICPGLKKASKGAAGASLLAGNTENTKGFYHKQTDRNKQKSRSLHAAFSL